MPDLRLRASSWPVDIATRARRLAGRGLMLALLPVTLASAAAPDVATPPPPEPAPPAGPVEAPGFYRLDGGAWGFQPRGSARFSGTSVDLQRDLGLTADRGGVIRAEWAENLADTAHPWYLPVQVSTDYFASTFRGQQNILPTTLLSLGPIVILQSAGTTVATTTEFRDFGAQVGWKLWQFQPGARLEGGLALKNVKADINVVSPTQNQQVQQDVGLTFPLPMLAVTAGRGAVRLRAEAQYAKLSGRSALNTEALVNWQPPALVGLGVEAGYRYRRYQFDNDSGSGNAFDLRLSGWRLGLRLELGPTPTP